MNTFTFSIVFVIIVRLKFEVYSSKHFTNDEMTYFLEHMLFMLLIKGNEMTQYLIVQLLKFI